MIGSPRSDEAVEFLQLLAADGGLHLEWFEVVTQVAVGVLVVVAMRQPAELPTESFAAGVVLTGGAPAVATPVAERLGDPPQAALVGEHRAPLAHRKMVWRGKSVAR